MATAGYALVQALIARGVVGDFRGPNLMRYADIWDAVETLRLVLVNEEHCEARFRYRKRVP